MTDNGFYWIIEHSVNYRLDKFVSEKTGYSRKKIKEEIIAGNVYVNSLNEKPDYKLKKGDKISYYPGEAKETEIIKENIPINIIYKDEDIIIINKPAGLVVHPGAGNLSGTLVNALLYHFDDWDINGNIRPGIVHRLDKDTSGLIIVARNDESQMRLVEMFKSRTVKKKYLALVYGHLKKNGVINKPIGRNPGNRLKYAVDVANSKEAITEWNVLEYFKESTFVEVVLKTGRTHQIRVHFSSMGHPLVGDKLYKRHLSISDKFERDLLSSFKRQALHAWKVEFKHPVKDCICSFEAPLPEDFRLLINKLEKKL